MRRLIIRPGGIGDCILSLPAIEHLKSGYTEVWVPGPVAPIIRFADRVSAISSTGLDLLGLAGIDPPATLIERLRTFDSIVSWYGANREELRSAMLEYKLPVRFLQALPDAAAELHATDFFLEQAGAALGAMPRIDCPATSPGGFAAIHPFSGSARKNWPLANFQQLAERLPLEVRWTAGPEEELAGAIRFENLYDLASWLRAAAIYIGNDSGITHLAAAAGVPVVAIFGPSDPAIWAPRGEAVRVISGGLADIRVEQVLEAALELLKR